MAWKLAWPVGALVIYLWQTWIIEIIGRKRRLQNENMSLAPMTLARDGAGDGGDGAGDGGAPDTVPESSCSDGGSSQRSMVVQAVFGSLASCRNLFAPTMKSGAGDGGDGAGGGGGNQSPWYNKWTYEELCKWYTNWSPAEWEEYKADEGLLIAIYAWRRGLANSVSTRLASQGKKGKGKGPTKEETGKGPGAPVPEEALQKGPGLLENIRAEDYAQFCRRARSLWQSMFEPSPTPSRIQRPEDDWMLGRLPSSPSDEWDKECIEQFETVDRLFGSGESSLLMPHSSSGSATANARAFESSSPKSDDGELMSM